MYRLIYASICLFTFVGSLNATSPNPADLAIPPETHVKAQQLVKRLGSEVFSEREAAQKELAALGRFARPALLNGVNTSPNPEVRHRCSQLLPKANLLDLQARLDTFLADRECVYEHSFPGWNQFRSVVRGDVKLLGNTRLIGDKSLDPATKEVFVELITNPTNRQLLLAMAQKDFEFYNGIAGRRLELFNQKKSIRNHGVAPREPAIEDVVFLLFAESQMPNISSQGFPTINHLIKLSNFAKLTQQGDKKLGVYQAIVRKWSRSRSDLLGIYEGMVIAGNLKMTEEACRMAVVLLTTENREADHARGQAIDTLIKYGGKQHVPLLEKAMSVEIELYKTRGNNNAIYSIQLRDMVLTTSILITGQKLGDYGLIDRSPELSADIDVFGRYYFLDKGARDAAFKKWNEWRRAHSRELP